MLVKTAAILKHCAEYIKEGNFKEVFLEATKRNSKGPVFDELIEVLSKTFNEKLANQARWDAFDDLFISRVLYYKSEYLKHKRSNFSEDSGTARFNWLIQSVPPLGLSDRSQFDYVMENKARLGVTMRPLNPDYSWDGGQDYDLGWFDEQVYRIKNPELFME